ncbi:MULTISPECIES: co-chaperone YbbN [Halomicrobium]|uniref:Thioredoxin n=1 Tax=Halomicrobium mukohataei TaxID=57705 RepID=A0A847U5R6_9EURY|nr:MULTISPECIES: thioredoxin family protein [Halomicrobium]MBO4247351.1 thioredoxin family protein [Halomicrobium sp. IBSBa]NLV08645.1 thioredoxin [Halomicrobium mukohataei]QGA83920.1 Thioredoxin [Halomicrobium sp. LC1Hm]
MATETQPRPHLLDSKPALDDLIASEERLLVEFHTKGCSLCEAMAPVLDAVAKGTDATVATMNPRDDPVLVDEYDVRSVPKLLLFVDGELVETLEDGFVPVEDVRAFVTETE